MDIFVFSDESGVFDKKHNDIFVFGGVLFFSKEDKDNQSRKYINAENVAKQVDGLGEDEEAKASILSNKVKGKLFRSLNQVEKFGIVIHQQRLYDSVMMHKKTKQRYLDWAFKYALRKKLEGLILQNKLDPNSVESLIVYADEHSTATNGRYELEESLEQEFRFGVFLPDYRGYSPPLFPRLMKVKVLYLDSKTIPLIRAADIVANRLFYASTQQKLSSLHRDNFNIIHHP